MIIIEERYIERLRKIERDRDRGRQRQSDKRGGGEEAGEMFYFTQATPVSTAASHT